MNDVGDQVGDVGIGLELVDHDGVGVRGGVPLAESRVHSVVDVLGDDTRIAADLQNLLLLQLLGKIVEACNGSDTLVPLVHAGEGYLPPRVEIDEALGENVIAQVRERDVPRHDHGTAPRVVLVADQRFLIIGARGRVGNRGG